MDEVSCTQLVYLAERAGGRLWDSTQSVLQATPREVNASLGCAQLLEIVQMLPNEAPLLRLKGVVFKEASGLCQKLPLQLVMRGCLSVHVRGIYRRLVTRCLVAVRCAYRECAGQKEDGGIVCAMGGGSNEMGWSILWDDISNAIDSLNKSQRDISTPSHTSPFTALSHQLAADMLRTELCRGDGAPPVLLVEMCRLLAKAYQSVANVLVANRMAAAHSPKSGVMDRGVQRLSLIWRTRLGTLMRGGEETCYCASSADIQSIATDLGLLRVPPMQDASLRLRCVDLELACVAGIVMCTDVGTWIRAVQLCLFLRTGRLQVTNSISIHSLIL